MTSYTLTEDPPYHCPGCGVHYYGVPRELIERTKADVFRRRSLPYAEIRERFAATCGCFASDARGYRHVWMHFEVRRGRVQKVKGMGGYVHG